MKKLRILLLPFMAVFEILLVALAWIFVFIYEPWARAITNFGLHKLPSLEWYLEKNKKKD